MQSLTAGYALQQFIQALMALARFRHLLMYRSSGDNSSDITISLANTNTQLKGRLAAVCEALALGRMPLQICGTIGVET